MDLKRVETIAESLQESDYKEHRDFFIRIAKARYPKGFTLLKELRKVPRNDGSGEYDYEVRFNEIVLMLIQYLNIEFEGKDKDLRDAVFSRIMDDILAS